MPDDIGVAIVGPEAAGIMPGNPPIMPIPAPAGKALTPQRQSHMHWPFIIVPMPGTTLAVAIAMEDVLVEDVLMEDVWVEVRVSRARHAMSLSPGALMLKRMPCSQ
jgi:hypothetical protein